jgi:outer membrane protein OmpA-like peptidoglycan-associated protein
MTTWQNFDGQGASNKLGDHLLQASIGLSVTIGKVGWKKGRAHDNELACDTWQSRDKVLVASEKSTKGYERNNYSGLNALRKRLANKDWDGISDTTTVDSLADSTATAANKYLHVIKTGKKYIGAPIYFFFKIGTHELTENAQFINIKEVAEVIKKYGLQARIIGAADSETGTPEINERLSVERADYIAGLLKAHGVDEGHIQKKHRGGIDSYEPLNGNRNTCVVLYFK